MRQRTQLGRLLGAGVIARDDNHAGNDHCLTRAVCSVALAWQPARPEMVTRHAGPNLYRGRENLAWTGTLQQSRGERSCDDGEGRKWPSPGSAG
jgi:hypothetical protein